MTKTAVAAPAPEPREVLLAQFRELLWFRLQLGAFHEAVGFDATLQGCNDIATSLRKEGQRLGRRSDSRSFGRWMVEVSRRISHWTGLIRDLRSGGYLERPR